MLKTPSADLTMLAKRNDGVFPIAAVNEIIDGRTLIAAHGNSEMPIWALTSWVEVAFRSIVDYLNRILGGVRTVRASCLRRPNNFGASNDAMGRNPTERTP